MQTQNGGAPTSTGHAPQPQLAGPSRPTTTRDGRILPPAVVNLIEMAMMDNAERWSFLFSDSDPTTLPITRKLYRQAVDSGILKAIRDVAGRVVGVERTQPRTWGRTWEEEIRMVIDSLPYEEWMNILNYDGLQRPTVCSGAVHVGMGGHSPFAPSACGCFASLVSRFHHLANLCVQLAISRRNLVGRVNHT